MSRGGQQEQAVLEARLEAGSMASLKEVCRDVRGTLWLENTLRDLRYASRTLKQSRGFTLAVITTLAFLISD
jgi:hypothetical protein